ncbi:hypothetical protein [Jeotgalibacillus soli]|uniref:Peptide ABC transporter permease n=1 Tax=Jeotgalibacillus soli TaxID=889306 RepID=A0A0C2VZT8_9BACL|nr:hypothetical protein [Jeotgalibacillus soli]KIL49448.1 hypothetical protein KP78_09160 [Jeotgalibacillus soli]
MTILETCNEVLKRIDQTEWQLIWPGFKPVAFCLYNEEKAYLFNHPMIVSDQESFYSFDREKQFVGDTLILYKDYPTAIVNVDKYDCPNHIYSILVHELFHGYQSMMNDKRFPDELQGVRYPLCLKNINLRLKERSNLYNAYMEKDPNKKRELLQTFLSYREQRKGLLDDVIEYEFFVETFEGPAWFAEVKAYQQVSSSPLLEVLKPYREAFFDYSGLNLHHRRSCYSSGLFLCLILEEMAPGWEVAFMHSHHSLSDFFMQAIGLEVKEVIGLDLSILPEAELIYEAGKLEKHKKFAEFYQNGSFQLIIEGNMRATFFDPINMICIEDQVLHQYFIEISINGKDYLIHQPALVRFDNNMLDVKELHVNLKWKPVFHHGMLFIDEIGEIKGEYAEDGSSFYLTVQ